MEVLAILFLITTVISGSILLWLYTKAGKKWLKSL